MGRTEVIVVRRIAVIFAEVLMVYGIGIRKNIQVVAVIFEIQASLTITLKAFISLT